MLSKSLYTIIFTDISIVQATFTFKLGIFPFFFEEVYLPVRLVRVPWMELVPGIIIKIFSISNTTKWHVMFHSKRSNRIFVCLFLGQRSHVIQLNLLAHSLRQVIPWYEGGFELTNNTDSSSSLPISFNLDYDKQCPMFEFPFVMLSKLFFLRESINI